MITQGYTEAALAVRQFLDWQEEWQLAKAVHYVLRRGVWPERSCRPDHLRRIEADLALAAYFASVQEADAWDDDVARAAAAKWIAAALDNSAVTTVMPVPVHCLLLRSWTCCRPGGNGAIC